MSVFQLDIINIKIKIYNRNMRTVPFHFMEMEQKKIDFLIREIMQIIRGAHEPQQQV